MNVNLTKINLSKRGDASNIPVGNLKCQLRWTASVDLDFYAFYRSKDDVTVGKIGLLGKMFGAKPKEEKIRASDGKVYFGDRGDMKAFPYIYLDQDAGIGDTGGDNKETLQFIDLSIHEHILIVANIYGKSGESFSSYDGKVIITADGKEFTVPLISSETGNYCVIARIDNTSGTPRLINVNKTINHSPSIEEFIN